MDIITANQLKTKGISVIESKLTDKKELIITVRGKEKYVIMACNNITIYVNVNLMLLYTKQEPITKAANM